MYTGNRSNTRILTTLSTARNTQRSATRALFRLISSIPFNGSLPDSYFTTVRYRTGRLAAILSLGIAILLLPMISGSIIAETAFDADVERISLPDSVQQGDDDIPSLIIKLQQGTSYEKQRAAISLGASKSKSAVEPLIAALNDPDLFVQNFAARALGNIGDLRAVEPLVKALKSGDILVQRSAANALGDLKSPEVVEPLIQALEGGNYLVRRAAAESLGNLGVRGTVFGSMEPKLHQISVPNAGSGAPVRSRISGFLRFGSLEHRTQWH